MTRAYEVRVEARVPRELRRISPVDAEKIISAVESLAENPRPPGVRRLVNQPGWRLRIGVYRILFEIDDARQVVKVYRAGHRRDVYR